MNLVIDIGNTRAKVAVFEGERLAEKMVTDHDLSGVNVLADRYKCKRAVICSTGNVTSKGEEVLNYLNFPTTRMTGETPVPLRMEYETPQTLGPDRIAAAVGAWAQKPGNDLMVVDCGTCVTFDFVDCQGTYLGGNIAPGLGMRLLAMKEGTERLPLADLKGSAPEIGKNTDKALRSGALWGLRHEICGYIYHFKEKYPHLSVFLTGGDAKMLNDFTNFAAEKAMIDSVTMDEDLVLRGLNKILDYNE